VNALKKRGLPLWTAFEALTSAVLTQVYYALPEIRFFCPYFRAEYIPAHWTERKRADYKVNWKGKNWGINLFPVGAALGCLLAGLGFYGAYRQHKDKMALYYKLYPWGCLLALFVTGPLTMVDCLCEPDQFPTSYWTIKHYDQLQCAVVTSFATKRFAPVVPQLPEHIEREPVESVDQSDKAGKDDLQYWERIYGSRRLSPCRDDEQNDSHQESSPRCLGHAKHLREWRASVENASLRMCHCAFDAVYDEDNNPAPAVSFIGKSCRSSPNSNVEERPFYRHWCEIHFESLKACMKDNMTVYRNNQPDGSSNSMYWTYDICSQTDQDDPDDPIPYQKTCECSNVSLNTEQGEWSDETFASLPQAKDDRREYRKECSSIENASCDRCEQFYEGDAESLSPGSHEDRWCHYEPNEDKCVTKDDAKARNAIVFTECVEAHGDGNGYGGKCMRWREKDELDWCFVGSDSTCADREWLNATGLDGKPPEDAKRLLPMVGQWRSHVPCQLGHVVEAEHLCSTVLHVVLALQWIRLLAAVPMMFVMKFYIFNPNAGSTIDSFSASDGQHQVRRSQFQIQEVQDESASDEDDQSPTSSWASARGGTPATGQGLAGNYKPGADPRMNVVPPSGFQRTTPSSARSGEASHFENTPVNMFSVRPPASSQQTDSGLELRDWS